ncbi:MAG: DinB-like domain protein [Gemmatimonadetes bacterium]|nr:DinB-like domain protein [Gemmatimonadota bacterium]
MITRTLSLLLLLAASLGAQAPAKKPGAPATVMGDMRKLWLQSTDYLVRSAAAVPDSTYAFQPTPAVRTFGQIIGHVAGSQRMFCALALGEKAPAEDEIEKTHTTKASLVQALKESNDFCTKAYGQSDAAAGTKTVAFGETQSRRSVLMLNTTHNFEHYGNVITYMRMKGMVPPSSQPAQ